MTFTAKKQFVYVGFRGTDTSLAGWKENFNMAFADAVPAQHQAERYLEAIAAKTTGSRSTSAATRKAAIWPSTPR